jgi:excisionase family DNA binding protein
MVDENVRPPFDEFLSMLADLLAEKYFERVDERMKKIPELRRLISAKEAGQYLSLSTDTIYRMASQKKLPYLKIGERVLFDVKVLDQWISKHMVKETAWKKQELRTEIEEKKTGSKAAQESDFLDLLKKKGKI